MVCVSRRLAICRECTLTSIMTVDNKPFVGCGHNMLWLWVCVCTMGPCLPSSLEIYKGPDCGWRGEWDGKPVYAQDRGVRCGSD